MSPTWHIPTFWSLAQVLELLIAQLHKFSINFINFLSFCRCICYLVFHMLFPSISMAVNDYTCITSVSEYSKSIRLLFKWIKVPFYGVLLYFTAQATYATLWIPLNFQDMVSNTTCLYLLHAGTGPCTSFYSGSLAEEVTKNRNYHKPSFLIGASNIVDIIIIESL